MSVCVGIEGRMGRGGVLRGGVVGPPTPLGLRIRSRVMLMALCLNMADKKVSSGSAFCAHDLSARVSSL